MAIPTMVDEEIVKGEKMITRFWSCPVKFIPESVWSFLKYKNYYEKHPSAIFPSFDSLSPRYSQAESVYEAELMSYLLEGG